MQTFYLKSCSIGCSDRPGGSPGRGRDQPDPGQAGLRVLQRRVDSAKPEVPQEVGRGGWTDQVLPGHERRKGVWGPQ